jgi:hypothetical protein
VCRRLPLVPINHRVQFDVSIWGGDFNGQALEIIAKDIALMREQGIEDNGFPPCDCPCDSLIQVEKPRFATQKTSHEFHGGR